jgi:hypothetical protein
VRDPARRCAAACAVRGLRVASHACARRRPGDDGLGGRRAGSASGLLPDGLGRPPARLFRRARGSMGRWSQAAARTGRAASPRGASSGARCSCWLRAVRSGGACCRVWRGKRPRGSRAAAGGGEASNNASFSLLWTHCARDALGGYPDNVEGVKPVASGSLPALCRQIVPW